MRSWLSKPTVSLVAATFVLVSPAIAGSATKDDAVAMVKSAVTFIKAEGPTKAYPEISNKTGKFVKDDLYVVVYQLDGKVLAHGHFVTMRLPIPRQTGL